MELPTNGIRQFVLKESLRLTHTPGLTVQSLRFQFGCSRTILIADGRWSPLTAPRDTGQKADGQDSSDISENLNRNRVLEPLHSP